MSALLLDHVSYETRGRTLLRDASLRAEAGSIVAVVGPNGAGKSTLLRLLCGVWTPSSGQVRLDDRALEDFERRELAREIAYVPQSSRPTFGFRVDELVAMGRYPHEARLLGLGAGEEENRERIVQQALEMTDIVELRGRRVTTLSGGELQRVLIARCLVSEASFLLLDEPTSSLDLAHSLEVLALCRQLRDRGHGIVVTLHDLNAARRCADRIVVLSEGRIVANGTPEEVLGEGEIRSVFGVIAHRVGSSHRELLDFELPSSGGGR